MVSVPTGWDIRCNSQALQLVWRFAREPAKDGLSRLASPPTKKGLHERTWHLRASERLGYVLERACQSEGYAQFVTSRGVPESARILPRNPVQCATVANQEGVLEGVRKLLPLLRNTQLVCDRDYWQVDEAVTLWDLLLSPNGAHPRPVQN